MSGYEASPPSSRHFGWACSCSSAACAQHCSHASGGAGSSSTAPAVNCLHTLIWERIGPCNEARVVHRRSSRECTPELTEFVKRCDCARNTCKMCRFVHRKDTWTRSKEVFVTSVVFSDAPSVALSRVVPIRSRLAMYIIAYRQRSCLNGKVRASTRHTLSPSRVRADYGTLNLFINVPQKCIPIC